MNLKEKQIENFNKKGYLVLGNFFDNHEMVFVSNYIDNLRKNSVEAKFYETSPINNKNILIRIENFMTERNLKLKNILYNDKSRECLTALFGESPVLFKEKINYKLPGCRGDKLHQDQSAGWNKYCDFFITMGIVVDKARKINSALSFMNSGNYKHNLMAPEWKPLSTEDPPYKPINEYSLIGADPGDVIFFDSYVPHGSPPNTSNQSRRIIFLTFNKCSKGDFRNKYYLDKFEKYKPNDILNPRKHYSYKV